VSGRAALFLDRDGVINLDRDYVCSRSDFEFLPGILDLVRAAKGYGYAVFVVTNQAGIGRGYYTEQEFLELTQWMCGVFEQEGAAIDKVYFCATHPEHGLGAYKVESVFRKPGPGMILQAAREFQLDLSRSMLVGDKATDIAAGVAAGVGCNVLFCAQADLAATNVLAASGVVTRLEQVIPLLRALALGHSKTA